MGYRNRLFTALFDLLKKAEEDQMKTLIVINLIKIAPPNIMPRVQQWLLRNSIIGDQNE